MMTDSFIFFFYFFLIMMFLAIDWESVNLKLPRILCKISHGWRIIDPLFNTPIKKWCNFWPTVSEWTGGLWTLFQDSCEHYSCLENRQWDGAFTILSRVQSRPS